MSRDPHTGTVRAAAKLDGALTAPSGRDGEDVALDYVREHARALGLTRRRRRPAWHRTRRVVDGRMQVITWGQRHRGIPSADTYLKAAIDDRGRLLSLTGAPAAELAPPTLEPALTAAEAVAAVTGAAPRARHAPPATPSGRPPSATAPAPRSSSTRARAARGSPGASSPPRATPSSPTRSSTPRTAPWSSARTG